MLSITPTADYCTEKKRKKKTRDHDRSIARARGARDEHKQHEWSDGWVGGRVGGRVGVGGRLRHVRETFSFRPLEVALHLSL